MINIRSAEIRENQRATEVRSCFPLTGHCPASVPGFYPESSWDELLLLSAPWNQHPDTEITMTGTTASPQRSVSSQSLHSVSQLLLWLDKATPTLIYNHHPTHPSAPSCWAKFNLWLPPSPFPTVELCISTSTTRASGKVSCCSSKNQLEEAFTLIMAGVAMVHRYHSIGCTNHLCCWMTDDKQVCPWLVPGWGLLPSVGGPMWGSLPSGPNKSPCPIGDAVLWKTPSFGSFRGQCGQGFLGFPCNLALSIWSPPSLGSMFPFLSTSSWFVMSVLVQKSPGGC